MASSVLLVGNLGVFILKAVRGKCFAHGNACFTRHFHAKRFELTMLNHATEVVLRVLAAAPLSEPVDENLLSLESIMDRVQASHATT